MRGALSVLAASAAIISLNAVPIDAFDYVRPGRGEMYKTTREWDPAAPITVHIMPQ